MATDKRCLIFACKKKNSMSACIFRRKNNTNDLTLLSQLPFLAITAFPLPVGFLESPATNSVVILDQNSQCIIVVNENHSSFSGMLAILIFMLF